MGFSRQEYWSGLPFPSGRPLHDPSILGGPTQHGLVSLSQTRLWSMWSDWLVFCDYGFSVSALWCSPATLIISLWFLLPWTWCISSQPEVFLSQKLPIKTPFDMALPTRGLRSSFTHQWAGTSLSHQKVCTRPISHTMEVTPEPEELQSCSLRNEDHKYR